MIGIGVGTLALVGYTWSTNRNTLPRCSLAGDTTCTHVE